MNKLLITLMGAVTLGITLPSWAGPDWQIIEKARKDKQATQVERHKDPYEAQGPTAAVNKGCPPPLVLPLDHGPRAQTTPWQNRQIKERHEAQLKACQEAAK
ncbi:hypothetical protein [Piscinibacter terrae]|uniref:Uncharacterized protein n=1 Tax=Piscinibacter terrae TaxID=2496871 RepID=A0A3N7ISK5_9BURK|nr:hypothetical protein [Albitalea terrae]RQP21832.1 hypothetical protein DZC73_25675 [Albitalea terrae]